MKYLLILLLSTLILGWANIQNKANLKAFVLKLNLKQQNCTRLQRIKQTLLKNMKLSGVLVFIPDKRSIVILHDNGNNELLKMINKRTTNEK